MGFRTARACSCSSTGTSTRGPSTAGCPTVGGREEDLVGLAVSGQAVPRQGQRWGRLTGPAVVPCLWVEGAGRGRYTYADGGVYDGEYLATKGGYEHGVRFPQPDGLKCGHGKRTWVSSNTYKGMWHDNRVRGREGWSGGEVVAA